MHLTSLPSPFGIGTMGLEARKFIDFLEEAGQSWWQILPVGPTSCGDSPYQSFSAFAGNPYLIDLDELVDCGLLVKEEYENINWGDDPGRVDYRLLYQKRYPVLRKAVARLQKMFPEDCGAFSEKNKSWLRDYALFMAFKNACGGLPWWEWPETFSRRDSWDAERAADGLEEEICFWEGIQYLFFCQWQKMKRYANRRGIGIIGDLPIYVARDSADAWAEPEQFQFDENMQPTEVSGCPPDGFSAQGQVWGNPLFDWEAMERDGYSWWIRRIRQQRELYDMLRIDHFRGLESYYAIPAGDAGAQNGRWRKGPGMKLFRAVEDALGPLNIIAEDLGFLTESVQKLLADSGYPGIKVLQFAFDGREAGNYLPHTYGRHCVAYVGTHDNDTALGWLANAAPEDRELAADYLKLTEKEGLAWGMMRGAWSTVADVAIVQAQDLLELGSEARMNTPSTVGRNWTWRALPGQFSRELAGRIRHETELYGRLPERNDKFREKRGE